MSHLAHTVKLKQAMLECGVTDTGIQNTVIQNAYVNAITRYLFSTGKVFGSYTEAVIESLYNRLNRWNNITPINGAAIVSIVTGTFPHLTTAAISDYGHYSPYPNLTVDGYDYRECPAYKGLADWLFNEMVNNND